MYQEDYLLRMIRNLVAAATRWAATRSEDDEQQVQDALNGALGLSLSTLDQLPASALLGILRDGDTLAAERLEALILTLEALAHRDDPQASERRIKAEVLRRALQEQGFDPAA